MVFHRGNDSERRFLVIMTRTVGMILDNESSQRNCSERVSPRPIKTFPCQFGTVPSYSGHVSSIDASQRTSSEAALPGNSASTVFQRRVREGRLTVSSLPVIKTGAFVVRLEPPRTSFGSYTSFCRCLATITVALPKYTRYRPVDSRSIWDPNAVG